MSIVQLEMPDNLWQFVSENARAQGYEDNAAYLLAVVEKLAQQQESLYPHGDNPTSEQLERQKQLLLESLEGEPQVVDEAWWDELHGEVLAEVAAKQNGGTKEMA